MYDFIAVYMYDSMKLIISHIFVNLITNQCVFSF